MGLADYSTMCVYTKGKNNVLANAISMLKTLNIYTEQCENLKTPVVSKTQEIIMKICATDMHTINTSMFHTEQKWNKTCRELVSQILHCNKNSFKSVIMSAGSILQKTTIHSWFKT